MSVAFDSLISRQPGHSSARSSKVPAWTANCRRTRLWKGKSKTRAWKRNRSLSG